MEPSAYQPTAAQHPRLWQGRVLTTTILGPCHPPVTAPSIHSGDHYGIAALGEDVHKYASLSLHTPRVRRHPAPLFSFSPAEDVQDMR